MVVHEEMDNKDQLDLMEKLALVGRMDLLDHRVEWLLTPDGGMALVLE